MPKLRIEAREEYRDHGKPITRSTLIDSVTPGDSTTEWQSEKVRSVGELKALVDDANKKKMISLLVESHFALILFPKGRSLDLLSLQFSEWEAKSSTLVTACKDLTVTKNMPAADKRNVVTLDFTSKGFRA